MGLESIESLKGLTGGKKSFELGQSQGIKKGKKSKYQLVEMMKLIIINRYLDEK